MRDHGICWTGTTSLSPSHQFQQLVPQNKDLASEKDYSPGDSPPGTPPASPLSSAWHSFPEEDSDSPQFRRKAHTFSHPPSSTKRKLNLQDGRAPGLRSPLLRQGSSEQCSDGEGRKRTSSTCSNETLNAGGTPVTPRRISWRQRIFLRVASPIHRSPSAMQQQDGLDRNELLPLSPLTPTKEEDPLVIFLSGEEDPEKGEEKKKSKEFKSLWKKAIHQQILLLRMEK
ncbi:TBC1 domain family member 4-like [Ochotona princeps]|uniref:TBC1 domain family member 4-like n=1 Tax=Ochotona princeps TaxID=9978 RepID=UPI002714B57A|nr:TBC1 domain family member 4-like [Ochotona princeps]